MPWTNEQSSIIEHETGHAKVSAVAGSGKTATLVERVARLLENGVHPFRILIVMFNASARDSFEKRLSLRLESSRVMVPEVKTFHSLGKKICGELESSGHIPPRRLETNELTETQMARQALENLGGGYTEKDEVESFMEFINLVKSDVISADDKFPEIEDIAGDTMPDYFIEAFEEFEDIREGKRVRFFSDLIRDPVLRMMEDEMLGRCMGGKYDHILVDEYQDINEVQQLMISTLAGTSASVMVVGDVDQCIYEWRGAKPDYIRTLFDADFEDATNYSLSYTFRYGHKVSLLANHLISENQGRDNKLCLSHDSTPATDIALASTEFGYDVVIDEIKDWVAKGGCYSDVGVLVRLYGMSIPIELALLRAQIPYRLEGNYSVFFRKEARMLIGYLRLAGGVLRDKSLEGPSAHDFVTAMLTTPSLGLSDRVIDRLTALVVDAGDSAEDAIASVLRFEGEQDWKSRKLIKKGRVFDEVEKRGPTAKADDVIEFVIKELRLFDAMKRQSLRAETGQDKIAICQSLQEFVGGKTVYEAISELESLMVQESVVANDKDSNVVEITSIHKAKGLEWPLVILPGMKEGSFPSSTAIGNMPRIEAERRLCYVGMTRTMNKLLVLHPEDTDLSNFTENGMKGPRLESAPPIASRFLYESNFNFSRSLGECIEKKSGATEAVDIETGNEYIEALGLSIEIGKRPTPKLTGGLVCGPKTPCRAESGMRVFHQQFGEGTVQGVMPRAKTFNIDVNFDRAGKRLIVAHMAVLEQV